MFDQKSTIIVGGGVIGLFSAYYLLESGRKIKVIDSNNNLAGCSYGNAGMIVPSHFIPLASPGMIQKGLKWMLNSESPFYIKPRLSLDLVKWGLNFYKSATKNKVNTSVSYLKQLGLLSKSLYHDLSKSALMSSDYEEKGLIMYCKEQDTLNEEIEVAHWANDLGIIAKVLSQDQIKELEPSLIPKVTGGVLYEGDAHLNPAKLMESLRAYLQAKGVDFINGTEITDFKIENNKISEVLTINNSYNVEDLVIATGSWSQNLTKKLNINLPMQAGKGYSVTIENPQENKMQYPSILVEARVAMTPMKGDILRIGGTMEIGGLNESINMNRVKGIIKSIPNYFPKIYVNMPEKNQVWYGFRPCSPDGMPYIGKSKNYSNLYFNTGHAMMGISLAPASGLLLTQTMNSSLLSMSTNGFDPQRFG
jgi:D-amino-acid dehydrogenase